MRPSCSALIPILASASAFGHGDPWAVEHCMDVSPVLPALICLEGMHAYGSTSTMIAPLGGTWTLTSPAPAPPPGYNRSMRCDFTGFNLFWRSHLVIDGDIGASACAQVRLFNAAGQEVGSASAGSTQLLATFLTSELLTPAPQVTLIIAWNDGAVCYADCNGDCVTTIADFGCFQNRWVLRDPYADCNADGQFTVGDFGCFQNAYVLCP